MTERFYDVAVVGGGFAGSILARCLALSGRRVILFERAFHPRFALGESSTPLANLSLERLAVRFNQGDLYALAAHGRWQRDLPELGGGLKRGFTFYGHDPGSEFVEGAERNRRLAVAASPDQEVADRQWLRSDVDAFLLNKAREAGVLVLEGSTVRSIHRLGQRGLELTATGEPDVRCIAEFVVDASGGAIAPLLGCGAHNTPAPFETYLFASHFNDLPAFSRVADLSAETVYDEEWSAVHHLTPDGWMYQLRFDDGLTSVGFEVPRRALDRLDLWQQSPEVCLNTLLQRYPTLARQFSAASAVRPIHRMGPMARRCATSVGERFALLPHSYAFFGPLFAPGMAWSLLGVERLLDLLLDGDHPQPGASALAGYDRLLDLEANHLEHLFAFAWREIESTRPDAFDRFARGCQAYFVAASFSESVQRLLDVPVNGWAWRGFLGADDAVLAEAFARFSEESAFPSHAELEARFEERNVAGLFDRERHNLYPVDQEELVRKAKLLGLRPDQMRVRLKLLRSPPTLEEARRL